MGWGPQEVLVLLDIHFDSSQPESPLSSPVLLSALSPKYGNNRQGEAESRAEMDLFLVV